MPVSFLRTILHVFAGVFTLDLFKNGNYRFDLHQRTPLDSKLDGVLLNLVNAHTLFMRRSVLADQRLLR